MPLHEGDIAEFDFAPYREKIDLISGGPPCQPFSVGGKHRGLDDRRDMWPQAVRAIRETAPRAFLFENVKGLVRAQFVDYLDYVLHQLTHPEAVRRDGETWLEHLSRLRGLTKRRSGDQLRYRVAYRVLNAANYGVPQKRERIVFVGFRSDLWVEWSFPAETHSRDALLWEQGATGAYWDRHGVAKKDRLIFPKAKRLSLEVFASKSPWRTVRDALAGLPDPEKKTPNAALIPNHVFQPGARSYPGHTGSPLDEPAKTLKAGVHGVPGGENMLRKPDGTVRYFTVREAARLQTFPDDFAFAGPWSENMRQIGNAVPVALATVVANLIADHLIRRDGRKKKADGVHALQPA